MAAQGVVKCEHGIVYTGRIQPQPREDERPGRNEQNMMPNAVRVIEEDLTEKLAPSSRIHYGKVYQFEHNVKAKSLGKVHRDSLDHFLTQCQHVRMKKAGLDRKARDADGADAQRCQIDR